MIIIYLHTNHDLELIRPVVYQIIMTVINLIKHASLGELLFLLKVFVQFNLLHRVHHAKTEVRIYGYVDSILPM